LKKKLLIAIDGTSSSGKGTLAKNLAKKYRLFHLDSGKLYRFLAFKILGLKTKKKINFQFLKQQLKNLNLNELQNERLTSEKVTKFSSIISKKVKIRKMLKSIQKKLVYFPPKKFNGSVCDGRDIGTKIIPNATVKIFLNASLNERAKRRYKEYLKDRIQTSLTKVKKDLRKRDHDDATRRISKAKPAKDAVLIDSSSYSKTAVFKKVCNIIDQKVHLINARS